MNSNLPNESYINISKGIWFVYHDGESTIRLHNSNLGNERVYLNEDIVSEQRSMSMINEHHFEGNNGDLYVVKIIVKSLLKGKVECLIYKNQVQVKYFRTKVEDRSKFGLRQMFFIFIASVIFSVLRLRMEWPFYTFLVFLFVTIIGVFLVGGKTKFSIEEDVDLSSHLTDEV